MGKVSTNEFSMSYAVETALGTIPNQAAFSLLEPNSPGTFGGTNTLTERTPISRDRQRSKGTVTDKDSAVEFDADLTLSSFRDFSEGLVLSESSKAAVTDILCDGVDNSTGYQVDGSVSAAMRDELPGGSLVWARGFDNAANNGLRALTVQPTLGNDDIRVNEPSGDDLVGESGSGHLSFAGYRRTGVSSGGPTWTYSASEGTGVLANSNLGTALVSAGLVAGQFVHIGSVTGRGATPNAVGNCFESAAGTDDICGYARVKSISANSITFDKLSEGLQQSDTTAPTTDVDILFGEFLRNVPTDHADYEQRSFTFEGEFPGLAADGVASQYEYVKGCLVNTATFNLPLTDKATVSFAFIGTDNEVGVSAANRKAGSVTDPLHTSAYNTSVDIARLRVEDDTEGLLTDFKSVSLTLGNNVTPEKVLGTLGPKYVNVGNFIVDLTVTALFTSSRVVSAIESNETVSMDFVIKNDNGVIAVDVPSMTLGDGAKGFPVNETVTVNVTGQAFKDEALGTSVGISIIPVPLP